MSKRDKSLECPFTWNINEELSAHQDDATELPVTMRDQPAIAMMNSLMAVYCSTVQKDYEKAKLKVAEMNELTDNMDFDRLAKEKVSSEVLNHIVSSTIFHVRKITKDDSTATDIAFERIADASDYSASPMKTATIHGCRAIAFSYYHEAGHRQAIIHARKAVDIFPECPLWHFILHKNYRRERKIERFGSPPNVDEKNAILKCTEMSNEPFYLIHKAEMYRECRDKKSAWPVYDKVYKSKPDSADVLLRLAHGSTKLRKMNIAKKCLDRVEMTHPENPMYLHYKGLYFRALENYEEAASYLKQATERGVAVAEIQYVACNMKADERFNYMEYLNEMLEKSQTERDRQNVLLHLAMQYRKLNELEKSCECFIRAIEIDHSSWLLKSFTNELPFEDKKTCNVFEYVNEFISSCEEKRVDAAKLQRLQELCSG